MNKMNESVLISNIHAIRYGLNSVHQRECRKNDGHGRLRVLKEMNIGGKEDPI